MIPTYIICSKLNILNSMSALIIPFMVSGFGIFLCRQFAEGIPNDILEAARIDGAGELENLFWHCNSYDQTCNRGTVHFYIYGKME